MASETESSRSILAPYCKGLGLDVGFGGDAVVPWALTFDLERPYCPSFRGDKQILRGNCRDLHFFCDESLDFIYSSHVLEDFSYPDLVDIIREWHRVLKPDGLLITNCPDQRKFVEHCQRTGQGLNLAHKEPDFSLTNFKYQVLNRVGHWKKVLEVEEHGPYSWLLVCSKEE